MRYYYIRVVARWPMQDLYHKAIEGHLVLIVDAQCVTLARVRGRTVAEEAGNPTINVLLKARDRPWSWFGQVLRMHEDRLVRRLRQIYP